MRFLRSRKLTREFIAVHSEDEVFLDPAIVAGLLARRGFADVRVDYLTPRFRAGYLGLTNRIFAPMIYGAAALGDSAGSQSYLAMSGRKR